MLIRKLDSRYSKRSISKWVPLHLWAHLEAHITYDATIQLKSLSFYSTMRCRSLTVSIMYVVSTETVWWKMSWRKRHLDDIADPLQASCLSGRQPTYPNRFLTRPHPPGFFLRVWEEFINLVPRALFPESQGRKSSLGRGWELTTIPK